MRKKIFDICNVKNHLILKEIVPVIPQGRDYEVVKVGTVAALRDKITKADKGVDGLTCLDSKVYYLTNNISVIPSLKVDGDFATIMLYKRLLNPHSMQETSVHQIIVYEKELSRIEIMGGLINAM